MKTLTRSIALMALIAMMSSGVGLFVFKKESIIKFFLHEPVATTSVLGTKTQTEIVSESSSKLVLSGIKLEKIADGVSLSATYTNNTSTELQFAPGLQVFLLDFQGNEHSVRTIDSNQPLNGGPMKPWQKQNGVLNYAVSSYKAVRIYDDVSHQDYHDYVLDN